MKKLASLLLLAALPMCGMAQSVDTIRSFTPRQLRRLKPGTREYLVFRQRTERPQYNTSAVWVREVAVDEKKQQIAVRQLWYAGDTLSNRQVYSLNSLRNFLPLYHRAQTRRSGLDAFNFLPDRVVGADSVADNKQAGFSMPHTAPTFNWELDLETLELLDYAPNKQFVINFYHPGSKTPPQWYEYRVVGKEKIPVLGGGQEECWLLKINYSEQNYGQFWVSVKTREVLKMEELFNGVMRYKVKLSTPAIPLSPRKPLI
ncbi:hypothetical protein [Hymenobacter sp. DG25B]|uniref:hypothetical protein n=1 Tax=Hymenobacter sp. DG25B TaxID=1385664 RepID=UPI000662C105|nr:hypothetical protein [Hymenobacter sp. DG25B]